jgi:hypothetical protein
LDWDWYNTYHGVTWPAAGNLDDDGGAEVVAGLGPSGGNWLRVWDDGANSHAPLQWLQLDWPAYLAASGQLRPAIGNLDADARGEIVVGFDANLPEWVYTWDDRVAGFAPGPWITIPHASRVTGTWPAAGRIRH